MSARLYATMLFVAAAYSTSCSLFYTQLTNAAWNEADRRYAYSLYFNDSRVETLSFYAQTVSRTTASPKKSRNIGLQFYRQHPAFCSLPHTQCSAPASTTP